MITRMTVDKTPYTFTNDQTTRKIKSDHRTRNLSNVSAWRLRSSSQPPQIHTQYILPQTTLKKPLEKQKSPSYTTYLGSKQFVKLQQIDRLYSEPNIRDLYRFEGNKKDCLITRIEEFMKHDIPSVSPTTLRYLKPKSELVQSSFSRNTNSKTPINTNSFPKSHLLAERETWSYNHKPGKCRYIRCPPSPILQPNDIFSNYHLPHLHDIAT